MAARRRGIDENLAPSREDGIGKDVDTASFTDRSLKGILVRTQRSARRRAQPLSTAHLLLTMLQSDAESANLLLAVGLSEEQLLLLLKRPKEEVPGSLERAVARAQRLSAGQGLESLRPVHLLWALLRDPHSAAHRCLQSAIDVEALGQSILGLLRLQDVGKEPGGSESAGVAPVRRDRNVESDASEVGSKRRVEAAKAAESSPRARAVQAPLPSRRRGPQADRHPVPEGRRSSLASLRPSMAFDDVLAAEGVAQHATTAPRILGRSVRSAAPGASDGGAATADRPAPMTARSLDPGAFPVLCSLGRNLTQAAALGQLGRIIGREAELERILDVLARRRANHPLLIGAPGVGKTAVAEALAQHWVEQDRGGLDGGPTWLFEVSAGRLVAGSGVRGALAQRLGRLRQEAIQLHGHVVLFIDEMHAVLGGQGSHEGPDDLGTELKSLLAHGDIACIGATTDEDYRRCIERDPALARRFTRVVIEEPSPRTTLQILQGVAGEYEQHHAVKIAADALDAAVDLSARYWWERRLPDKALSLLDTAAARVKRRGGEVVDRQAIATVLSEQVQMPVERLLEADGERLLQFEERLAQRIIGHGDAIARIATCLRSAMAGFRGQRPMGVFLLLGPTGVGKTETAKAVADLLFPTGGMSRFDMSVFNEAHSVSRLVGAPPGYVGHERGGQLTEAVRARPYQVLLLDEIEKAHPQVWLSLLAILDEGRIADSQGRQIDFSHTVIFMTSNLGTAALRRGPRLGFHDGATAAADQAQATLEAARRELPAELWNRLDETLFFAPLRRDEVRVIARQMLDQLIAQLRHSRQIEVGYDAAVIDHLIDSGGYDPTLGARPLRRTLRRLVESPLADAVLAGELKGASAVQLEVVDGQIRMNRRCAKSPFSNLQEHLPS